MSLFKKSMIFVWEPLRSAIRARSIVRRPWEFMGEAQWKSTRMNQPSLLRHLSPSLLSCLMRFQLIGGPNDLPNDPRPGFSSLGSRPVHVRTRCHQQPKEPIVTRLRLWNWHSKLSEDAKHSLPTSALPKGLHCLKLLIRSDGVQSWSQWDTYCAWRFQTPQIIPPSDGKVNGIYDLGLPEGATSSWCVHTLKLKPWNGAVLGAFLFLMTKMTSVLKPGELSQLTWKSWKTVGQSPHFFKKPSGVNPEIYSPGNTPYTQERF